MVATAGALLGAAVFLFEKSLGLQRQVHLVLERRVLARGKQTSRSKTGKEKTSEYVVAWTNRYMGKTRVFATTLGHNNETVADPRYLDLVTRGLLWSVNKLDSANVRPPTRPLPSRRPAPTKEPNEV